MALTEKLAEPELSADARLVIAVQNRLVLLRENPAFAAPMPAIPVNAQSVLEHAPPDFSQSVAM